MKDTKNNNEKMQYLSKDSLLTLKQTVVQRLRKSQNQTKTTNEKHYKNECRKENENSLKLQIKKFIVKNVHNKRKGKQILVFLLQNCKTLNEKEDICYKTWK